MDLWTDDDLLSFAYLGLSQLPISLRRRVKWLIGFKPLEKDIQ